MKRKRAVGSQPDERGVFFFPGPERWVEGLAVPTAPERLISNPRRKKSGRDNSGPRAETPSIRLRRGARQTAPPARGRLPPRPVITLINDGERPSPANQKKTRHLNMEMYNALFVGGVFIFNFFSLFPNGSHGEKRGLIIALCFDR